MVPFRRLLLSSQIFILSACAGSLQHSHTADVPLWESPHQICVQRVGVATFTGGGEHNRDIEKYFCERLEESGYFDVVPLSANGQIYESHSQGQSMPTLIEAARVNNVDILVIGRVGAGYGKATFGNAVIGAPVHKLIFSVKLIDPLTGKLHSKKQVLREFKGEVGWHPESDASEAALFARLGRECVNEVVRQMFVSHDTVAVVLASPDRNLSAAWKGNRLAQQGRWAAARKQWAAAAKANPGSGEVQYNLGLACEACQQYVQARKHYAAAKEDVTGHLYEEAIARCDHAEAHYVAALAQRQRLHEPVARRLPPDRGREQFSLRRLPVVR